MEKELTAYILQYLLDHEFDSKADMARQLGINPRAIQKVFENMGHAKAGTISLDKAVMFCACHEVSVDAILKSYMKEHGDFELLHTFEKKAAYLRLKVAEPSELTDKGKVIYSNMVEFLRNVSEYVCPSCELWCNPWDDECAINEMDCYIGNLADSIGRNAEELYGTMAIELQKQ